MKDKLKGGLSDDKSVEDIANKFDISVADIKKQLEIGGKVELEHVNDESLAKEISLDHLIEIPDYYTRLKEMEDKAIKYWKTKKRIKDIKEKLNRLKPIIK